MKILLALTFAFFPLVTLAEEYHLYLLAGQSNMDGRGKNSNLTKEQAQPSKSSIIFYNNPPHASDGWQPLEPGYSIAPKYKGKLPSPTFGPELGFVDALTKAQPDQKLALIKGSKGGTNLRKDWAPGEKGKPKTQGPRYRFFLEAITKAKAALKKEGHTFELKGLIWHQGESDSKTASTTHQKRLAELMARLRTDLEAPQLPFVLGEVFDNGKRDKVRSAIQDAAKADPACGLVSAKGLTTWDAGTHFDAKSQWTLGERFAEEMLKLTKPK